MTTTSQTCEHCLRVFKAPRPQRFCSMECRNAGRRFQADCLECGTHFSRKKSQPGSYCSRTCSDKNSKGRTRDDSKHIEKTCPGCENLFITPVYKETEYCSRSCRARAGRVEKNCPICNVRFSHSKSWPVIHCSQKCYGISVYQGGPVYYGGDWARQRLLALERDGERCVECGSTKDLHVHHILPRRSFGDDWRAANHLDNLLTLCPTHHLARHGGRYH